MLGDDSINDLFLPLTFEKGILENYFLRDLVFFLKSLVLIEHIQSLCVLLKFVLEMGITLKKKR